MASLAIGIRYLTGYAVATFPAGRDQAEWPPHPARVFMALAAAHFETGEDNEEAEALQWLERQADPAVLASEADERSTVTTYVPVNDKATGSGMLQSTVGLTRSKQPRTFPRVRPHEDTVYLIWPNVDYNGHRPALERLCAKVTRVGHSSSLVHAWMANDAPEDVLALRWEPDEWETDTRMRVPTQGLFARLKADFPHNRPAIGTWRGYRRPRMELDPEVQGTVWDPHFVVRRLTPVETRHPRLDLVSTLQLTAALQKAVVANAAQPVPEFISGHQPKGKPSEHPHLAFLPLGFVGHEHATGHLMGMGIALPAALDRQQRMHALAALGSVEELCVGPLGKWTLAPDDEGKTNLREEVWTAGSRGATQWATVTPVAYDKHPKAKDRAEREKELAGVISQGCQRIGLPKPAHVMLTAVSPHLGVPAAHEFPRLKRKDGGDRRHAHAILIFDEPIRGPVAVGAGRYRGYGFCRPVRQGG